VDFTFCPVETELAGWDGGIPTSASGICVLLPSLLSCLSRHNVLDLQTAIEIYTPLFALFFHDFRRSSNSLQLDEAIARYVGRLFDREEIVGLVNNKHPMVPLSTMEAGFPPDATRPRRSPCGAIAFEAILNHSRRVLDRARENFDWTPRNFTQSWKMLMSSLAD
jgi:Family of unknown function (DUF6999)